MESIKIYLCQLNFHVGNLKNNLDKILSTREEVRKQGGDLCIFSELFRNEFKERLVSFQKPLTV